MIAIYLTTEQLNPHLVIFRWDLSQFEDLLETAGRENKIMTKLNSFSPKESIGFITQNYRFAYTSDDIEKSCFSFVDFKPKLSESAITFSTIRSDKANFYRLAFSLSIAKTLAISSGHPLFHFFSGYLEFTKNLVTLLKMVSYPLMKNIQNNLAFKLQLNIDKNFGGGYG